MGEGKGWERNGGCNIDEIIFRSACPGIIGRGMEVNGTYCSEKGGARSEEERCEKKKRRRG